MLKEPFRRNTKSPPANMNTAKIAKPHSERVGTGVGLPPAPIHAVTAPGATSGEASALIDGQLAEAAIRATGFGNISSIVTLIIVGLFTALMANESRPGRGEAHGSTSG